jgi:hypothetical protein
VKQCTRQDGQEMSIEAGSQSKLGNFFGSGRRLCQ